MSHQRRQITFCDWTNNRELTSLGTNSGARSLPFQDWCKIKEAFAPELIARALKESPIPVRRCIDPFGGSGTTGIACQFLGVHPILAEVNPYMADLIEAKICPYTSTETLNRDFAAVMEASASYVRGSTRERWASAPLTLVEPGRNGRWIFNAQVADLIIAFLDAIEDLDDTSRRLFRVLLGGILVKVSNVRVSGKGRRYRGRWKDRGVPPECVSKLFSASVQRAIKDIDQFANRSVTSYEVRRGDSRRMLHDVEQCELAVLSPPYPNSSDYTDVYNVELWTLGYLDSRQANVDLRSATLSSHVQISRNFPEPPMGSPTLTEVLARLNSKRSELWDPSIPAMVGAYFRDLMEVLGQLGRVLVSGGSAWIVVGESRYAGVQIPVAKVLGELIDGQGWEMLSTEPFRAMRSSAQQGGEKMLAEQLLVIRNEP